MRSTREATLRYEHLQHSETVHVSPITRVVKIPKQQPGLTPLQKWGYSLALAALLFGGIQAVRCGLYSSAKLEGLLKQLAIVQQVHHQTKAQHMALQDKISLYSSPIGIEEIARDRLDMIGQDEILVRIYPKTTSHTH